MLTHSQIQTVFNFTKTDKAIVHGYDEYYFKVFKDYKPNSLLEIGVKRGSSILAWSMLFPKCKITGMDIKNEEFISSNIIMSGAEIIIKDSTKKGSERAIKKHDVIIDDGSHYYKDIIKTFYNFKNKFNKYYIIEDSMYKTDFVIKFIKRQGFKNVEVYNSKMKPIRADLGWLWKNKPDGSYFYPQLKFIVITR